MIKPPHSSENSTNHQFLLSLVPELSGKRIVLASQSPRRIELLQKTGWKFSVVPSTIEESDWDPLLFSSSSSYASELAFQKALEVSKRLKDTVTNIEGPDLIISGMKER
ncbi:hypothetical protein HMI55_001652 [Coelomomyces lativittatus]|nr:hypothetical protein HMI55_001652 [Coelomomyces lativittatus]